MGRTRNDIILRGFDLGIAGVGVIVSLPVCLVIAAAIKLTSPGPILFRQTRIGQGCEPFEILKFRTMRHDATRAQGEVAAAADEATIRAARAQFRTSTKNDTRITPVGKVLRRSHLDELPQFLNVLRGDMSMVGPRPDTPAQQYDYSPAFWAARHSVPPGITGVFQVARGSERLSRRNAADLLWVKRRGPGLYVRICAASFAKVLRMNSV